MLEYKENSELAMLRMFILMTMADEEYHEEERKMIHDLCMKYDISPDRLEEVIKDVSQSEEDFISICKKCLSLITNQELKNTSLKILSELSTADYILHEDELVLLELAAQEWQMKATNLKDIVI